MGQPVLYHQRTQTPQHVLVQHDSLYQTLNNKNISSIYKLNNNGEITPPCFTPFEMPKLADFSSPHLTWHNWLI